MKKQFISLCMALLVSFQVSAQSISAKINAYQPNQIKPHDKAGKVIVACVCEDLFPAMQELMAQNTSELKDMVKIVLSAKKFNKEQLIIIKTMVREAQPLVLEGVRVCAPLIKKHGKNGVALLKKIIAQSFAVGGNGNLVVNAVDQAALEQVLGPIADDENLQLLFEKIALFNEKWAEQFANIMQVSEENSFDQAVIAQELQDFLQKILATALSNKRAVRIHSSVAPSLAIIKTKRDGMCVMQSCVNELESKVPHLVVSIEQFAEYSVPFLAAVVSESVDEIIQGMPA